MRVLSDWRLRGMLGLVVVAGGLGWMTSQSPSTTDTPLLGRVSAWLDAATDRHPGVADPKLLAGYGALPLHFEPNVGQSDPAVKFLAQSSGYSLFLTNNEAVLRLSRGQDEDGRPQAQAVLRARLEGANPAPVLSSSEKQSSYSNYFIGNDPRQWHSGVAHYGRVHYGSVWPGIDLVYYGNQRQLEYDFIVKPGANPGLIRMSWHGADNLYVDNEGNLIAETALGPVRQHKPVVYQTIKGERKSVEGRYALNGRQVSFALGDYDRSQPLVIDPVLVYSTYLGGGSTSSFGFTGIAVTPKGRAFVTGYTDSTSYPLTDTPYQDTRKATYNTVVSQIDYNGMNLIYSTYLGGTKQGRANGIAVNSNGEAYVAGTTLATDFPLTPTASGTPYQASNLNSKGTGFVTKLSADGKTLGYSTYLGGSGGISGDRITAIALDAGGQAYVTGDTDSTDFPHNSGIKPTGTRSGFVSILNAGGSALVASSFLGGNGEHQPNALALAGGDIYVAGTTLSTDLAAINTAGGGKDAFVSRLSADTHTLRYTRYVGGSNAEEGYGVAADSNGNVWIAGSSRSTNFPVLTPPASLPPEGSKAEGVETAFLSRLDNSGNPTYSTFLGVSGKATTVALTSNKQPAVAGQMTAAFTPVEALAQAPSDTSNAFISLLKDDGSLAFFTALGGSHSDELITALALDEGDGLYVAGTTRSNNFPLEKQIYEYSTTFSRNGFVSKLTAGPEMTLSQSLNAAGVNMPVTLRWQTIGADSCRWRGFGSDVSDPVSGTRTVQEPSIGTYEYTLDCLKNGYKSSETVKLNIVDIPTVSFSLTRNNVAVNQTAVNQELTVSWSTTNTDTCTIIAKITDTEGTVSTNMLGVATNGSIPYSPLAAGTEEYTLSCKGPASETAASTSKTLLVVPVPTLSLSSPPGSVNTPGTITYSWNSEGVNNGDCSATTTTPASATPVMTPGLDANGSFQLSTNGTGKHTFKLNCTSSTGLPLSSTAPDVYAYDTGSAPVISLTSSASPIKLYQSVTLSWQVQNANSCTKSTDAGGAPDAGTGSWAGNIASPALLDQSSAVVLPQTVANHSYTLSCTGPGGNASKTVEVEVEPPPAAAVTALQASPNTLSLGQSTTISWQSSNATSCTASSGSQSIPLGSSGNALVTPASQGTQQITLVCTGAGGPSDTVSIPITVTAAATGGGTGGGNTGDGSSSPDNGSSGGPVDFMLLGGLGLLGLARRRQLSR
ncbi:MAG: SBBP repeat-containing protein [Pedobacter sp.]|nr:SBBP repeat-containing protein [Pedobacter sp.]